MCFKNCLALDHWWCSVAWCRRKIITVRGQSYVLRLPKYWSLNPGECVPPSFVAGGGHTRRVERGWGVNILEDARHSSVLYLYRILFAWCIIEEDDASPHLSATVTGVHSRDHCGLVRAGCAFLLHVCEDETQLHAQIFSPSQVFSSSSKDDCCQNFLSLLLRCDKANFWNISLFLRWT